MATNVPPSSEASVTSLVSGIIHDAEELIKQQVALLKHDIRTEIRQTKEAFTSLVLGGAIIGFGAILLSFMLVYLFYWLVPAVPLWVWFLVVGVVVTAVGGVLVYAGIRQVAELHPLPENTVEALGENLRWTTRPTTSDSR
jgi:hypothetical protein